MAAVVFEEAPLLLKLTPMLVQLTSVLLQLPPVLLPLSIVVIEPPVDCGQQLLIRHPITLPRRHKGVKKFSPV